MYTASFGTENDGSIIESLRAAGVGHFVTVDGSGEPVASALPFVVDDGLSVLRAHFARANPQWRDIDGRSALMIVPGPDAYISPNWYPSKREHHRVVPTSNYELVHLRGRVTIHDDPAWKLRLVTDLTHHHERRVDDPDQSRPWEVQDAPGEFITKQLTAIVGVEVAISSVEMKRKMSQNKSDADRLGAADGLRRSTDHTNLAVAELMDPR
jgi:transcriptional regulator